MSANQPDEPVNTNRELRRRRMNRVPGAIFVACIGLMSFFGVVGNSRFESYHTIDVIRLMTAGASIAVFLFLVIRIFNFPEPRLGTLDRPEHDP